MLRPVDAVDLSPVGIKVGDPGGSGDRVGSKRPTKAPSRTSSADTGLLLGTNVIPFPGLSQMPDTNILPPPVLLSHPEEAKHFSPYREPCGSRRWVQFGEFSGSETARKCPFYSDLALVVLSGSAVLPQRAIQGVVESEPAEVLVLGAVVPRDERIRKQRRGYRRHRNEKTNPIQLKSRSARLCTLR